ncbi:uncharacterized protein BDZ83DRAFT_616310 [Colletotrichum acutatum]|uniref:Uncharacterized protein n=1 Tax=Glomerella acutata TaxID=27357 RepID=A0AAD8XFX6_GLOAC|nr:uncharacterized protein BDZ83DRAFT_616310 [Colletotrichum acutatum]KAK1726329.1 hypothetical protein BDZ83DRAFT_616310 [Colletotrichum acutatum]
MCCKRRGWRTRHPDHGNGGECPWDTGSRDSCRCSNGDECSSDFSGAVKAPY